ncbi:hypothetical protein MP638_006431 [Amoeboaphelidium occidentale]|nr:hypothetical protein MP638_006431 [Amoeboaphelidium occidentale]
MSDGSLKSTEWIGDETSTSEFTEARPKDYVFDLMESIYAHNVRSNINPDECLFETIMVDDSSGCVDRYDDYFNRILYHIRIIVTNGKTQNRLSFQTALAMMRIAVVAQEFQGSNSQSFTQLMFLKYRAFALSMRYSNFNDWTLKQTSNLYQYIRRGKRVMQVCHTTGGEQFIHDFLPKDFKWSRCYCLSNASFEKFVNLLSLHVQEQRRENVSMSPEDYYSSQVDQNVNFIQPNILESQDLDGENFENGIWSELNKL